MKVDRRGFLQCTAAAAVAGSVEGCADGGDAEVASGTPGLPARSYFDVLARDLDAAGHGTPQVLVDLDRMEANVDAIVGAVGRARYRIVEKSLPSLELLAHVRARAGVDRFLVLHLPFLPHILGAFPGAQVMVGKPQSIAAVRRFFDDLPSPERRVASERVTFLADGRARLDELAALGRALSLTLRVAVEIDVGLHRGGVRRPEGLPEVLTGFGAGGAAVRFAGMLGYDGHVAHAPTASGLEEHTARAQHRAATATYQAFVDALRAFGGLWRDDLVFDSGGTATFPLYREGPVNDVAVGGGALRPAAYPATFTGALSPAVFIAAPVLARFDRVELPFLGAPGADVLRGQQGLTICGGGWAADFVSPPGASLAPLVSDPENQNLVPNQTLLVVPESARGRPGDWVFQHPRQADAIFQFEHILLVRGGRLQATRWRSFPRRY